MNQHTHLSIRVTLLVLLSTPALAAPFDFSTGVPNGLGAVLALRSRRFSR